MLNKCIFVLWAIYTFLFILSLFYTSWLIYRYKRDSLPFTAVILGAGSQFMMILSKSSQDRTSVSGYFMFMLFIIYSVKFFADDVRQSRNKSVKKYFRLEPIIAAVCVCACMAHAMIGGYRQPLTKTM